MKNKLVKIGSPSYTLTDSNLLGGVKYTVDMNNGDDYTIGGACSASIEFVVYGNNSINIGDKLNYSTKMRSDNAFKQIGIFYVADKEKDGENYKITAYDSISKFDIIIDSWLESLTFPMTITYFFNSLCNYCGVSKSSDALVNGDFVCKDNFTSTNMTGRQILQYIAAVGAGNAIAKVDGSISIKSQWSVVYGFSNAEYTKFTVSDYVVPAIDKLWVGQEDGDIGVVSGTGNNVYKITYNPLLFADTASEIQAAVDNIYTVLHANSGSYYAGTLEMLEDGDCNIGTIINVYYKNRSYVIHPMKKIISPNGVIFESKGKAQREVDTNNDDAAINQLRGKYNVLKRDLEQTESRLGDAEGNISTLQQTSTQIQTQVQNLSGQVSTATQTVNGFERVIQGDAKYTESSSSPSNPKNGDVWKNTSNNTYYRYLNGVWSVITEDEAKNLKVISSISETMEGVVFTSNLTDGTTTISGNNIKTGTIAADRLNLTGEISWADLTQDVKNRIGASTYSDADVIELMDERYNITHTAIDGTVMVSPKIIGAEIYAGAGTNKGLVQLSADGINFATPSKSNVIAMGYVPVSSNQLPIITMGAGVDEYGSDMAMIKKYSTGVWIGDSDDKSGSTPGSSGTSNGLFVDFANGVIYKYQNGFRSELGSATFG